jgi:diaminopimelate epimerase
MEAAVDLPFLKVTAGGNDFVLVDNRNGRLAGDLTELVRAVCHRRLGVGADGMILVQWSRKADLRMVYHNSDGGEANLCGNGLRCLAFWAASRRVAPPSMTVETGAGVFQAGWPGSPGSDPWITVSLPAGAARQVALPLAGRLVGGTLVEAGVPVLAVEVEAAWGADSLDDAPALRSHPDLGPAGANVTVFTRRGEGLLEVRYYERGVEAETLSSGTGSIGAAVAAWMAGAGAGPFTCRNREGLETRLDLEEGPGGSLAVTLAAPVAILYHGRLRRDLLARPPARP